MEEIKKLILSFVFLLSAGVFTRVQAELEKKPTGGSFAGLTEQLKALGAAMTGCRSRIFQ